MFFFFYNQISFPFSFSCTCLMGTFEKTECNSMCKVFTEVFLIARIPHSTVLIHFVQREKAILNLVTVVVGSLTTWTGFHNGQLTGTSKICILSAELCYSHFSSLMYLGCCIGSGK